MDKDDLRDIVAIIAEERIRQAMEDGEFDNLPGEGRPLELEDLSFVAEHLRAGFKLLRNAGFVPVEVELRREMAALEEAIAKSRDEEEKRALNARLQEKTITYSIMMEKYRKRPHSSR